MRLPAGLLVLVLAAACSGSSEPRAVPSTAGASPTTAPAPTSTRAAAAAPSKTPEYAVRVVPTDGTSQIESFQSPSHNMQCSMGLEENGTGWIRCDVREHVWELPPPTEPCDGDWGSIATVSTDSASGTMGACASDAAGGPTVLGYGHGVRLGELECRSAKTGMTCLIWNTSHGFVVSKAAYRLF